MWRLELARRHADEHTYTVAIYSRLKQLFRKSLHTTSLELSPGRGRKITSCRTDCCSHTLVQAPLAAPSRCSRTAICPRPPPNAAESDIPAGAMDTPQSATAVLTTKARSPLMAPPASCWQAHAWQVELSVSLTASSLALCNCCDAVAPRNCPSASHGASCSKVAGAAVVSGLCSC